MLNIIKIKNIKIPEGMIIINYLFSRDTSKMKTKKSVHFEKSEFEHFSILASSSIMLYITITYHDI